MSEEIALAAADLALVARLTRERDALAIQVRALADQAADLTADRDHWTLEARRAEQRARTVSQVYQQQQTSHRELEALSTAMTERAQQAEQELAALRELYTDVERWRESGGDVRDLSYVLETADRIVQTMEARSC